MSNKTDDIIKTISDYLVNLENEANNYLPLEELINPIKQSFNSTLEDLKYKAENSDELSDKVFYLTRYTDLIKKLDSIFDARSKRLQQSLMIISKLPNTIDVEDTDMDDRLKQDTEEDFLTPEQANEVIKILHSYKNNK